MQIDKIVAADNVDRTVIGVNRTIWPTNDCLWRSENKCPRKEFVVEIFRYNPGMVYISEKHLRWMELDRYRSVKLVQDRYLPTNLMYFVVLFFY